MTDSGMTAAGSETKEWSLPARIGFRLALIYWLSFFLCGFLDDILPSTPFVWVGQHLFGLTGEAATPHFSGSDDRALDYVQFFCTAALALVGTILWSAVSE